MNKTRRKEIEAARTAILEALDLREALSGKLEDAKSILEQARDDEEEYKENMPEGFQNGEQGERADAAISALEEAMEKIDEVVSALDGLDEMESFIDTATE